MPNRIFLDHISGVIEKSRPALLTLPVPFRVDHADHIIKTALEGHTKLAADHILHPEMKDKIVGVVGSLVRRLNIVLMENSLRERAGEKDVENIVITKHRIYDALLEIVWNLIGVEKKWAGISEKEATKATEAIVNFLRDCEKQEKGELGEPLVLKYTIITQLNKMKLVNKGNSMVAWMAREIEKDLKEDNLVESYTQAINKIVKRNFYYVAYEKNLCKFGNDYALGLRWLRHLGYVQVSTNPVLAAIAYDDDPSLCESFKEYVKETLKKEHPEWFKEPENYIDDITMEATRFALLDNFYVFRIPFLLSKYHEGLVSYQLNPLIADNVEKSVAAARAFAQRLENTLMIYDSYLLWGYNEPNEKGRPNLVIKVAAAYPASIETVRRINENGIGQNITLSYTVAQEVILGIAALEGMATAMKKGIMPTQTYDTNMGGRLEDHLRESTAANLLLKALEKIENKKREEILNKLSDRLKIKDEEKKDLKGRVEFLTSKRILSGNLLNDAYIEALVETNAYGKKDEVLLMLKSLDDAIKLSGTYVAKRVYEIMFSPWNKPKWIEYLVKKFGISEEDAKFILDRIDLLPASKRKPIDTLSTLSRKNVTNTEFPNHQLDVVKEAMKEGFKIEDYKEAILQKLEEEQLKVLMSLEDFVKAYEASPELNELLEEAGISGKYGNGGIRTKDWSSYGPCAKTLEEFTKAYLAFRDKVLKTVKEVK